MAKPPKSKPIKEKAQKRDSTTRAIKNRERNEGFARANLDELAALGLTRIPGESPSKTLRRALRAKAARDLGNELDALVEKIDAQRIKNTNPVKETR